MSLPEPLAVLNPTAVAMLRSGVELSKIGNRVELLYNTARNLVGHIAALEADNAGMAAALAAYVDAHEARREPAPAGIPTHDAAGNPIPTPSEWFGKAPLRREDGL